MLHCHSNVKVLISDSTAWFFQEELTKFMTFYDFSSTYAQLQDFSVTYQDPRENPCKMYDITNCREKKNSNNLQCGFSDRRHRIVSITDSSSSSISGNDIHGYMFRRHRITKPLSLHITIFLDTLQSLSMSLHISMQSFALHLMQHSHIIVKVKVKVPYPTRGGRGSHLPFYGCRARRWIDD